MLDKQNDSPRTETVTSFTSVDFSNHDHKSVFIGYDMKLNPKANKRDGLNCFQPGLPP
jgi:hypothetical protein